jgi:hypothetical protein
MRFAFRFNRTAPDWQSVGSFLVRLVLKTNPLCHQLGLVGPFEIVVEVPHVHSCIRKPFLVLVSLQIMQTRAFGCSVFANVQAKTLLTKLMRNFIGTPAQACRILSRLVGLT